MGQENVAFQHHVTWSRLTSRRGTTYDSVKKTLRQLNTFVLFFI